MTEPFIEKVDHVAVSVDDLGNSERFLTEVLGFKHVQTIDVPERGMTAVFFRSRNAVVELMYLHDGDQRRDRLGSAVAAIDHIGFQVGNAPAVADSLRHLGVQFRQVTAPQRKEPDEEVESEESSEEALFFTEPDTSAGIIFQFVEERPAST